MNTGWTEWVVLIDFGHTKSTLDKQMEHKIQLSVTQKGAIQIIHDTLGGNGWTKCHLIFLNSDFNDLKVKSHVWEQD